MRSNYKPIGDYVTEVKERNTGLLTEDLRGVSINKAFMPSVANIHGTDLTNYKVVRKGQFAFNPMHVGRDEVLPIAHLTEEGPVIVSPAYVVFEVADTDKLLPQYLMMWCRRPEFDRNAWFTTDSSVRGGFSWSDYCELTLPVPSIEKQREIVREYEVVVDRVRLNERLNAKLEEAAQAIYKQWFVEFEFPMSAEYARSIGKPEQEGKAYKSSGGEMVFNEALAQEIPAGWESKPVYDTANFTNGSSFKVDEFVDAGKGYPIIKIAELKAGVTQSTQFALPVKTKVMIDTDSMLYSWSGNPETSLEVFTWFGGEAILNQHIFRLTFGHGQYPEFVYYLLKNLRPVFIGLAEGKQTTGLGHVTVKDLKQLLVAIPNKAVIEKCIESLRPLYAFTKSIQKESIKLAILKDLLLAKTTQAAIS